MDYIARGYQRGQEARRVVAEMKRYLEEEEERWTRSSAEIIIPQYNNDCDTSQRGLSGIDEVPA